ncbi:Hypothetical protein PHPALM_18270 [Phytophthora palmivora]|uniref:Integrase catalytic domain-containing protein n=1 Tax=Phytophthora palmivora TaxID=4796 RepID=A0A2P4XK86_9STRA|nr:Hypothetical protein PHPALM_18270 [Phytophthora palmivora]
MVRESKSPHSTPTFCVRKPNGKWRLVHAYNKLNNATVPAQTPIPRKDVLLNNMSGCTLYSALDLVDGYYQILMRESDIPLTAASTPSGMLWEWIVMPQGLSNAPVTRPDGCGGESEAPPSSVEVMRANKLYANIDKCVFAAEEIKVLSCFDDEGRERVISFQSRQLKVAERNYPVHDKGLLAMGYALVKFRRMARWLSFFAEYNFRVEYKPGKLNVLADALSRRPDYELAHVSRVTTDLYDRIHLAYQVDENYTPLTLEILSHVAVPNGKDMKYDILLEAHDAPMSGHLGREKTYQTVSQTFWWPRMYKWLAHYVKTYCWKSMSLDFVFGLPADDKGNTGILVFVCRLTCSAIMVYQRPSSRTETIISDRDPRFTGAFWGTLFQLLGTKLTMSTADHPQTDGQTESVNRVLEDTLRSICAEAPRSWSDQLPIVEFALNHAVHASTGFTPFYLNG